MKTFKVLLVILIGMCLLQSCGEDEAVVSNDSLQTEHATIESISYDEVKAELD